MDLVDEEDHPPFGVLDLLHCPFQPLLEFAAEAGSGNHGSQVELYYLLAAQDLGHVVFGDFAGQTLSDGGLADTGAADEYRVVLGAAAEYLDKAQDLGVASDDRVELALPGQLGQVAAVLFQSAVTGFSVWAGRFLATAQFFDCLQDALARHAEFGQDTGRSCVLFAGDGQEEMLGRDVVILQLGCFFVGEVHHPL